MCSAEGFFNSGLVGLVLVGLVCTGCASDSPEPKPNPADTVTVGYDMAEAGIEWLELVVGGASEESIRTRFFDDVAPTEGCQAIIRHWSRFREWNEEIFYEFILKAMGRLETNEPLVDENGNPTRLGHARRMWTAALKNPAGLRHDLEALRKADVRQSALQIAKTFLPDDADVTSAFQVVLFGASPAFSVGDTNGFDLLQLAKKPDGTLDVEQVMGLFAHEMHHSGFSNVSHAHMSDVENIDRLSLVGTLAAEGMATWFITPPFEHLEDYRASSKPLEKAVADDWDRHLGDLTQLYRDAEKDIGLGLGGEVVEEELISKWVKGVVGPAYVVGTDMIRTIEEQLGVDAAKPIAQDYRRLLDVYNQAASKANASGGDQYVFDEMLVSRAREFGVP
jgi:hypothetical protein